MSKKELFCPFSEEGCETEDQTCMFWRKQMGCELEALMRDLQSIPNLLRHIEAQLERTKE